MAKQEQDFKVGDRVFVPQSHRAGIITSIESRNQNNPYAYSSEVVIKYTISVPFMNLLDTGNKYYIAEFNKNEFQRERY